MKSYIEQIVKADGGVAAIDWTVFLTGLALMAISVFLTITGDYNQLSDDTYDRVVEAVEHVG